MLAPSTEYWLVDGRIPFAETATPPVKTPDTVLLMLLVLVVMPAPSSASCVMLRPDSGNSVMARDSTTWPSVASSVITIGAFAVTVMDCCTSPISKWMSTRADCWIWTCTSGIRTRLKPAFSASTL